MSPLKAESSLQLVAEGGVRGSEHEGPPGKHEGDVGGVGAKTGPQMTSNKETGTLSPTVSRTKSLPTTRVSLEAAGPGRPAGTGAAALGALSGEPS